MKKKNSRQIITTVATGGVKTIKESSAGSNQARKTVAKGVNKIKKAKGSSDGSQSNKSISKRAKAIKEISSDRSPSRKTVANGVRKIKKEAKGSSASSQARTSVAQGAKTKTIEAQGSNSKKRKRAGENRKPEASKRVKMGEGK